MQNISFFIILALLYFIAKIVLEKRFAPLDAMTHEGQLSNLAYSWGCSTYDIFRRAGSYWNFSKGKIESDFNNYLSEGFIPKYVADFVTHNSSAKEKTYHKILYPGGRPPYL